MNLHSKAIALLLALGALLLASTGCTLLIPEATFQDGGGDSMDAALRDAGDNQDTGPRDAGQFQDAGSDGGIPGVPTLFFPTNGYSTGSLHSRGTPATRNALRPRFRWDPVVGASHYELEVDDSCATDFPACAFPSPEVRLSVIEAEHQLTDELPVSEIQPVGRRYHWRVRACLDVDGCSAWTAVRYVDVGRLPNDYDGDGYADVVVGAYRQDSPETDEGSAYVYRGSMAGPSIEPLSIDNPLDQPEGFFGVAVSSLGDVNGDGYADLAVSAHLQDNPETDEGSVYIYFGSRDGPPATPTVELDNPLDQDEGYFGVALAAAGDVNGDGYADLIVGASGQDAPEFNEGTAYVYFGSSDGISSIPSVIMDNPLDQAEGRFAHSVAGVGDVNGDGYSDLIVGAYRQDNPESDEGSAYLYLGGRSGPSADPDIVLDNPLDQSGGRFALSTAAAGDVNGDGYADVVVGAYLQDAPEVNEGSVYVFHGSRAGLSIDPDFVIDNPFNQPDGRFGYAVSGAGDVNGDGYSDLIVGAYRQDDPEADEGVAYVYYGSGTGIVAGRVALDNPLDDPGGRFGFSVAGAGDIDGDGYADAIVGAYWQDNPEVDEGSVYIFLGSASGIATLHDAELDNPLDQSGGDFGHSVGG